MLHLIKFLSILICAAIIFSCAQPITQSYVSKLRFNLLYSDTLNKVLTPDSLIDDKQYELGDRKIITIEDKFMVLRDFTQRFEINASGEKYWLEDNDRIYLIIPRLNKGFIFDLTNPSYEVDSIFTYTESSKYWFKEKEDTFNFRDTTFLGEKMRYTLVTTTMDDSAEFKGIGYYYEYLEEFLSPAGKVDKSRGKKSGKSKYARTSASLYLPDAKKYIRVDTYLTDFNKNVSKDTIAYYKKYYKKALDYK